MSIVIPVGVDTADTSYLDMAAGSEWVKTTTSLITLPSTCSSHFHKGLHHWLKKVHPHAIPAFIFHPSLVLFWTMLLWNNMISCSLFLNTCLNMYDTKADPVALFNSLFSPFFSSHVYKVTANEKGICSPWKQGSYWACLNGQFSLDVDFNSTAHHRCSHILIFGPYYLLVW